MSGPSFLPWRIFEAAGLVVALVVAGVVGYMLIEGWNWFDALYMTVTTLTTVGGGEAHPLSTAGRAFTIGLITLGVGVVFYALLGFVEFAVEGQLAAAFGGRRMWRRVSKLEGHFILCGFGRVGREIAREFTAEQVPFVVIDINQQSLELAVQAGYAVVTGDAANIDVLKQAGIERARGLVTAVDSDAHNIFVTLSARVLRPNLFIVARANAEDADPKLRLAGANRIISPYTIGGRRMANLAMRPTAVEFVDTVLSVGNAELLLEDVTIPVTSRWIGKPLGELMEAAGSMIILAIKRGDQMIFRPADLTQLEAADELVAAGRPEAVRALEQVL
jgi:voltage-gated potassium channel